MNLRLIARCIAHQTLFSMSLLTAGESAIAESVTLRGKIVENGRLTPARIYIRSEQGKWHHAESQSPQGAAFNYNKIRESSQEVHTTLSAHPFQASLPPGRYTLTVERGKEYHTLQRNIEITEEHRDKPLMVELPIERWINMADLGWYSGDTHVHRRLAELPNLVAAEDLNVAFPLTYWVTDSTETPAEHNKNRDPIPAAKLIQVDDTHVIWPVNTEYEIFTVARKEAHARRAVRLESLAAVEADRGDRRADRPLKPSKQEVDYLVRRMEDELTRHKGVLSKAALAEFEQALQAYQQSR